LLRKQESYWLSLGVIVTTFKTYSQGAAIGIAASIIAGTLFLTGALDWMERPIRDWRSRMLAAPGKATSSVCTIMIDQSSLDDAQALYGFGWPWPRQVYGYILDFCQRAGAKAVAFDLIFTETSSMGVDDDKQFGDAIARGIPFSVAFPMSAKPDVGLATNWMSQATYLLPMATDIDSLNPNKFQALALPSAAFPIAEVATNATILANVVSAPDADAVYRRVPPLRLFDDRIVPNLGLSAYLATQTNTTVRFASKTITVDDYTIPLDDEGNAILRFRGPTQTHKAFNATAIMQSEARIQEGGKPLINPLELKGKYVLLGVTAPGLLDLKPTPMGRTYPGVEVHATFLDNLLSADFLRQCPRPLTLLIMLAAAMIAGALTRASRRILFPSLSLPIACVLALLAGVGADKAGWWLPVAPLLTASLLTMITAVIVNYAVEGQQKRFIKGAFKQYLSPLVIDKLMANPDSLQLGGEEKELSIFFSDVQGFTSISEKLTPSKLTALLNEYLTAMTNIIHETGGTIDKYEGDAIIAFWNAPLDQHDHAERAVRAALLCQAKLASMRDDLHNRYGSKLFVRIGINTGPVVVGNMGSDQRFDYTFLGDAGNLAARLEGINKQFGSYLIVSHFTRKAFGNAFPVRELSKVRVVGKAEPITIFEPMLPEVADKCQDQLRAFQTALNVYYQGDFSRAQKLFDAIPDDPIAATLATRCIAMAANPPPDWDGIWTITEK
jgi:adenylate cyclase